MKTRLLIIAVLLFGYSFQLEAQNQEKPNVVLILMDNFGWGELGCYGGGILRGAPTPRIDGLAEEGMRLLNFNVEAQCTPSRAALMTGRYAVRTGNGSVPVGSGVYGLTQWEYTMAEMFSDKGYKSGIFGKWHLGDSEGRYPTDQGFDEWFGIPNSSDESYWPTSDVFRDGVHPQVKPEYVMESTKGKSPSEIKVYDLEERAIIDRKITTKAKDFIKRKASNKEPFFCFIPYTQTHLPVVAEPSRQGATGNGKWADILAQLDDYVGELIDQVDESGIKENTIFIFTSDNGPEALVPHQGFGGPWRGSYFTGLEGSLRVPFLIRYPGKIPAKSVSNEIVHQMDVYTTLANIIGADLPKDRVIDGKDQTDFFFGKTEKSPREDVVIYLGNEIFGVKWRNWKMVSKELDAGFAVPTESYEIPLIYNLHLDPKEEQPMQRAGEWLWVRYPVSDALINHMETFQKDPKIKPGTPDPYLPAKK